MNITALFVRNSIVFSSNKLNKSWLTGVVGQQRKINKIEEMLQLFCNFIVCACIDFICFILKLWWKTHFDRMRCANCVSFVYWFIWYCQSIVRFNLLIRESVSSYHLEGKHRTCSKLKSKPLLFQSFELFYNRKNKMNIKRVSIVLVGIMMLINVASPQLVPKCTS